MKTKKDDQPAWLKAAGEGIAHGDKLEIVYERGHYALVRLPGFRHREHGMPTYTPVAHYLLRKGDSITKEEAPYVVRGRITKEQLLVHANRVDYLDRRLAPQMPKAKWAVMTDKQGPEGRVRLALNTHGKRQIVVVEFTREEAKKLGTSLIRGEGTP